MSLSWPWHFVSLSVSEQQHRRELLDLRGCYAQLSVLLAIVIIRLYNAFTAGQSGEQSSKRLRSRSWLNSPPFTGWAETRSQYLVSLVWLGWLLGLSMWSTGDDYLHLTKALGHVGLSQIPLQVAMSPSLYISASKPRSSSSLLSVLTSIPQPTVTAYHRVFGRVVISPLLIGHATLYSLFFLQSSHPDFSSLFAKRIRDLDVQWGMTAATMAVAILFFARPTGATGGVWRGSIKARRRSFYIAHVSLVGTLCLAVYFHVVYAQKFVLQAVGSSLINLGCCLMTAY